MKKLPKNLWRDLKLSMFWIGLATIAISGIANKLLLEKNQELTQEITICRHNINEITKQIDSGQIILRLKTKGGE